MSLTIIDKIKVMTVVGTRPEIIKLSEVIRELDENTEHTIVHTGQNYDYELNEIFFNDLELRKPDYFLDVASKNVGEHGGYSSEAIRTFSNASSN